MDSKHRKAFCLDALLQVFWEYPVALTGALVLLLWVLQVLCLPRVGLVMLTQIKT